ncbi:MAG: DUF418 domain-containing protein [Chitinophagaceae bacterium]
MNTLAPVQIKDRELFMDVLRGLSILGIFIANLQFMSYYSSSFNGSYTYPSLDKKMSFLHAMFIEGKFYSIFSLLFGWGIALQMSRSKLNDTAVAKFIRRRLWFMLLLGSIHLFFIWIGDIVAFYALVGFILVALRKKSNKQLLTIGIVLVLSPIILYFLKMKFQWLNAPAGIFFEASNYLQMHLAGVTKEVSETDIIRSSNSLWTDIKMNIAVSPFRFAYLIFVSRIPKVLGMMLIGFVIRRSGFYKKVVEYKRQVWWFVIIGLAVSIPANYMLAFYMENPDNYYNLKIEGWYETVAYAFGVAPLAMVYVAILALLFQQEIFQKILNLVAPVGKMAFTNYMSHSIIGIVVFHNIGFGYMQQLGIFALTIFAAAVFIAQIIISTIWLRFFEFGPVEWVWRSLTYGKMQKMVK